MKRVALFGVAALTGVAVVAICLLLPWSGARYRRWVFQAPSGVTEIAAINAAGLVVARADDGTVTALDQKAGQVRWKWTGSESLHMLVSPSGAVFVQGEKGEIRALDGATGKPRWAYRPAEKTTTVSLGPDRTLLVTGKRVVALNEETGKVKGGDVTVSGTERGLSVAPGDVSLSALDSATGQMQWQFSLARYGASYPRVGDDETVYAASQTGFVFALRAGDGSRQWETNVGARVTSPPTLGPNHTLLVSAGVDQFCVLDAGSGAIRENAHLGSLWDGGDPVVNAYAVVGMTSPAIGLDGTIFMGSANGKVYALRYP